MSCNKCNTEECGCVSNGMHVLPPSECNTPECVAPPECEEVISTDCIVFLGEDKTCGLDTVYESGDTIVVVVEKIVDYFCSNLGDATIIVTEKTCGLETVYATGDTIIEALEKTVDYFCGAPLSIFTNDVGYITSAGVPTNVSAFTNDAGYVTSSKNIATNDLVFTGNSTTDFDGNTAIFLDAILDIQGEIYSKGKNSIIGSTAFGEGIFSVSVSGIENTAFGYEAMRNATTAYENTAVGKWSLRALTVGYYNTAVGLSSLLNNQGGYLNTAIGYNALFSNVSAALNTAVGGNALVDCIANSNTALGFQAGKGITIGENNLILGSNVTQPATINNCIIIGAGAVATGNNQVVLGSAATPVGSVDAVGTFTQTNRMIINLNGVDYYIALDAV